MNLGFSRSAFRNRIRITVPGYVSKVNAAAVICSIFCENGIFYNYLPLCITAASVACMPAAAVSADSSILRDSQVFRPMKASVNAAAVGCLISSNRHVQQSCHIRRIAACTSLKINAAAIRIGDSVPY